MHFRNWVVTLFIYSSLFSCTFPKQNGNLITQKESLYRLILQMNAMICDRNYYLHLWGKNSIRDELFFCYNYGLSWFCNYGPMYYPSLSLVWVIDKIFGGFFLDWLKFITEANIFKMWQLLWAWNTYRWSQNGGNICFFCNDTWEWLPYFTTRVNLINKHLHPAFYSPRFWHFPHIQKPSFLLIEHSPCCSSDSYQLVICQG